MIFLLLRFLGGLDPLPANRSPPGVLMVPAEDHALADQQGFYEVNERTGAPQTGGVWSGVSAGRTV